MRLIDGMLFIEWAEAVDSGIPEGTLKSARSRNSSKWLFVTDPSDSRKVLIDYDRLTDEYKNSVKARYGDPYLYAAASPIRDLIKFDGEAEKYYLAYRYSDKPLAIDIVKKYTKQAGVLNMLKDVTSDKRMLKRMLQLSVDQFYVNVMNIIKEDNIGLPTSYRRLLATKKDYETNGYESLIDGRLGNAHAAKIKDEISQSLLLELLSHPNQFDDPYIASKYNVWAVANGYKQIDVSTVKKFRQKHHHLVVMKREGNNALNEKYLPQIKGKRPSQPLYLVESDDNHLDLFYADPDDSSSSKYYHRYKAIVVMDSFNDYVLGYAYAEEITVDLVKAAYLNAMYHIRSITGAWYLPHEIKTDNWSQKALKPFYRGIAKYIDTPVGSKHRGYIEQFFGSSQWKNTLKAGANNYTGNNITAKRRGVNPDTLSANKKDIPLVGAEASAQIENFFHRLRYEQQPNGTTKHDQWLAAFNRLDGDKKRVANEEQFFLKFGIQHQASTSAGLPRLSNRGIRLQIANVEYSFDLDGGVPLEHIGKKVHVIFDPYDMSRVLVTDFEKVRLIGREPRLQSRALEDAGVDSRTYLNAALKAKVDIVTDLSAKEARRKQVLQAAGIDAETILKAGIMVKEIKQQAEVRILQPPSQYNDGYNWMDQL